MTKVVYNNCYGRFSLSRQAVLLARKISKNPQWGGPCLRWEIFPNGLEVPWDHGEIDRNVDINKNIARHDPVLVYVVEKLKDKANTDNSTLEIRDIGKSKFYKIEESRGKEKVVIKKDSDRWISV
jgi:hypothetical protein